MIIQDKVFVNKKIFRNGMAYLKNRQVFNGFLLQVILEDVPIASEIPLEFPSEINPEDSFRNSL